MNMSEHEQGTISVTINGDRREVPEGLTVGQLLEHFDLHPRLVVVEKNREILRRQDYETVSVDAGDSLELVHFVGGG